MKSIIFLGIFLSSVVAQASFFQTSCSNADATVKTGVGHRFNGVMLISYTENGVTVPVEFINEDIVVTILENTELRRLDRTTCVPGQSGGGGISKDVWSHQRVILSRADQQAFADNILVSSDDRKSIETDFICHEAFNSRTSCP